MASLLIEVRGGVIQQIVSTDPSLDITIVDHDNPSVETGCEITEKSADEIFGLMTKYENEYYK